MGLNIFDRIQAKIELFRLEQRYTKRRNRRSTFVSNATYVDGEYVYNLPNNTTGSSANSSSTTSDYSYSAASPSASASMPAPPPESESEADIKARKRANRWSSMPGLGQSSFSSSKQPSMAAVVEEQQQQQRRRSHDWI